MVPVMGALVPHFRTVFHLSATQTALLVTVPVLLGSLARIPMVILTDRYGGPALFTVLMLMVGGSALLVPLASSYSELLLAGLFLGMAGSSFAIGVGFVSRWFPPDERRRRPG